MISEKLHVYLTSHENLNRENTKKRVPVRVGIVHVHVQVHVADLNLSNTLSFVF